MCHDHPPGHTTKPFPEHWQISWLKVYSSAHTRYQLCCWHKYSFIFQDWKCKWTSKPCLTVPNLITMLTAFTHVQLATRCPAAPQSVPVVAERFILLNINKTLLFLLLHTCAVVLVNLYSTTVTCLSLGWYQLQRLCRDVEGKISGLFYDSILTFSSETVENDKMSVTTACVTRIKSLENVTSVTTLNHLAQWLTWRRRYDVGLLGVE